MGQLVSKKQIQPFGQSNNPEQPEKQQRSHTHHHHHHHHYKNQDEKPHQHPHHSASVKTLSTLKVTSGDGLVQSAEDEAEFEARTLMEGASSTRHTSNNSSNGIQIVVSPRTNCTDNEHRQPQLQKRSPSPTHEGFGGIAIGSTSSSSSFNYYDDKPPRRQSYGGSSSTSSSHGYDQVMHISINHHYQQQQTRPITSLSTNSLGNQISGNSGNVPPPRLPTSSTNLTGIQSSTTAELTPKDIIAGFGWGSGESEEAQEAIEASFSQHSLSPSSVKAEQCFSPMGSIDLSLAQASDPVAAPVTEKSGGHLNGNNADAYTAEDIIDSVKSKHEDEAYSMEEFTASAAFGVQLSVDHPLATSGSKILLHSHSPLGSQDRVHAVSTGGEQRRGARSVNSSGGNLSSSSTEGIEGASDGGGKSYTVSDKEKAASKSWSWSPLKPQNQLPVPELKQLSQSADRLPKENTHYTHHHHHDQSSRAQITSTRTPSSKAPSSHTTTTIPTTRFNEHTISGSTGGAISMVDGEIEALKRELPRFEREIKRRMYPEYYRAGQYIIRKHEIGKEMYFLSKGKVEVVSGDGRTVYSVINRGSFFGAYSLVYFQLLISHSTKCPN
jgi:hypothetical protein